MSVKVSRKRGVMNAKARGVMNAKVPTELVVALFAVLVSVPVCAGILWAVPRLPEQYKSMKTAIQTHQKLQNEHWNATRMRWEKNP